MSLIAVEAAITVVDPASRQGLIDRSVPIQQATRDDKAGCIVYCFAADPCRDDLIQVYELWESEDALLAHFAHPNYHAMRTMLNEGGLASAVSRKHRIDASAPVYGPDRTPTAAFE